MTVFGNARNIAERTGAVQAPRGLYPSGKRDTFAVGMKKSTGSLPEGPHRSAARKWLIRALIACALVLTACRPWQPAPGATAGEDLYRQNCVTCHGVNGGGADGPSLIAREHTADEVAAVVRSGGSGMRSFEGVLSPEEIKLVSEYAASLSRPRSQG